MAGDEVLKLYKLSTRCNLRPYLNQTFTHAIFVIHSSSS